MSTPPAAPTEAASAATAPGEVQTSATPLAGVRALIPTKATLHARNRRERSPYERLASEMGSALRRFQEAVGKDIDDTSVVCSWHRQYHDDGDIWPWAAVGALHEAEDMARLFDGIRAVCRG